jgi:hypothetical protein
MRIAIDIHRDVTARPPVWVAAVLDRHRRRLYQSASASAPEATRRAEAWAKRLNLAARPGPASGGVP